MSNIENYLIPCVIEYRKKRYCKFNYSKVARKMAAVSRYRRKYLVPKFSAQLKTLLIRHGLEGYGSKILFSEYLIFHYRSAVPVLQIIYQYLISFCIITHLTEFG